MKQEQFSRYARHISLSEVGVVGQEKLLSAKVLVVGAGGLGCPVLQYLAAAGVGRLGVMDFDFVEMSNLQRQVIYGQDSLGLPKVKAAQSFIKNLNPDVLVDTYQQKVSVTQVQRTLFARYDIVVDATDNAPARYAINDLCVDLGLPFVHASIYKFKGQVSVFNYQGGPTYRCLFPDATVSTQDNCSELGVFGALVGVLGGMQACEVIKMILGLGQVLSGSVLMYDALTLSYQCFALKRGTDLTYGELGTRKPFKEQKKTVVCESFALEIGLAALCQEVKESLPLLFVDVSAVGTLPKVSGLSAIQFPWKKLQMDEGGQLKEIFQEKEQYLIAYCQSGITSLKAARFLREKGYPNAKSLRGGFPSVLGYVRWKKDHSAS